MSVGLVIVTHGSTGASLLEVAEFILSEPLDRILFVPFRQSCNDPTTADEVGKALRSVDSGDGVLVLTDLVGSSPSNLVAQLLDRNNAIMVTGLNLAMLIRVWNYREQPLGVLVQKAVEGGRRGVKILQQ